MATQDGETNRRILPRERSFKALFEIPDFLRVQRVKFGEKTVGRLRLP